MKTTYLTTICLDRHSGRARDLAVPGEEQEGHASVDPGRIRTRSGSELDRIPPIQHARHDGQRRRR